MTTHNTTLTRALQRYTQHAYSPLYRTADGGELFVKNSALQKTASGSKGKVTFALTTNQIDRANDRVRPTAFAPLPKSIPLLWSHDANLPPIGKVVNLRYGKAKNGYDAVLGDPIFHDKSDLSKLIHELVNDDTIETGSIGFIPLAWQDEDAKPYLDRGEAYPFTDKIRDYISAELLEFSICNVPMNPGAMSQKVNDDTDCLSFDIVEDRIPIVSFNLPPVTDVSHPLENIPVVSLRGEKIVDLSPYLK